MAKELERAQNILREFGKTLRKMPAHPAPEEVHKLRTAARRIEVAIATTLPLDGSQKERRLLMAVNRLPKAPGEVRDMDMLTSNAHELSRQVPAASLEKLVRLLERMREILWQASPGTGRRWSNSALCSAFRASSKEELVAALGRTQRSIGEWHDWQQLGEVAYETLDAVEDWELLDRIGEITQQKLNSALAP